MQLIEQVDQHSVNDAYGFHSQTFGQEIMVVS